MPVCLDSWSLGLNCYVPFTASKRRQVKRGVKEVVKGIRKGEKGYVLSFILNDKS